MKYHLKIVAVIVLAVLSTAVLVHVRGADWRTADRSSVGIAPSPEQFSGAVIQVYAARTFGWRGALAVHTWIATKNKDAKNYIVHQVLGWRKYRNLPVVSSQADIPDRNWFNNKPVLLVDLRGPEAGRLVNKVLAAVQAYPYQHEYTMWPGPNSNTFTAFIGRSVPELKLNLPPTAIGKDYLPHNRFYASAPSGSGHQVSIYGLAGIIISREEGLELNILGLDFGINPLKPSIRLPGFGTVGTR